MKIRSLTAFELPVRLRKPIRHASHSRDSNDTLILRCELQDGTVGWGEGLPRTYVTGESMSSVWRHLTATDFSELASADLTTGESLIYALDKLQLADVEPDAGVEIRECFGNSLRCALEIAMVDAFTRQRHKSFADIFYAIPESASVAAAEMAVRYSGVITAEAPTRQLISALKMKVMGFPHLKVKVGTEGLDDEGCLRRVRRIVGRRVDLRVDANEAWHCETVLPQMKPLLQFDISSLEQPVPHSESCGLRDVRKTLDVPVMLDESLCSMADAERAVRQQSCDSFNLRLSKCGGLVSCVRLAAYARQHNIGYQLGCQVGETGILSAAGRHFACNVANIRYLEGSYDRFLLRESFTTENLTFGYRGQAPRIEKSGLGISVQENRIRAVAKRTRELLG